MMNLETARFTAPASTLETVGLVLMQKVRCDIFIYKWLKASLKDEQCALSCVAETIFQLTELIDKRVRLYFILQPRNNRIMGSNILRI